MSMTDMPQGITPEEFAKHFGWSPRRVRSMARELGACRIVGNKMILLQQDVDTILEATRPKPKTSAHGVEVPIGDYEALKIMREKSAKEKREYMRAGDTTEQALKYLAKRRAKGKRTSR